MSEFTRGILIKKDGIYYRDWDDGEQLENKVESFIPYLNEEIRVEDDITFEDFFNHVMDNHEIISVIFASQLGHFDLGKWVDEWKKPFVDKPDGHTRTKYLQVAWSTEWWDKSINGEYREVEEWVGFGGRGETLDEETGDWMDDMGISFSFTPINEMKGYPFKIDTEYRMLDWERYQTNKTPDDPDYWYCVIGHKKMTVFDVVGGILDDISFYGDPDRRDETGEEIRKTGDELDEIIKEKGIEGAEKDGHLYRWDPDKLFGNDDE